jgi:hypothetical protein
MMTVALATSAYQHPSSANLSLQRKHLRANRVLRRPSSTPTEFADG